MKSLQLIIAIIFFPLTIWYAVGVAFRNLYYDRRDKNNSKSEIQNSKLTIGIGNLRMGGTGKTPHTEYLIRLLSEFKIQNSELKISLLSRGYGRKTKGFLLADDIQNSKFKIQNSKLLGDEPLMMHRKFPDITVAVCEDRAEGIRRLSQLPQPPDIVLLDDVYQHRSVKPSVNILLTEYSDLYSNDHILPFGNLREFRSGSRRADIIIVTKCPPFLSSKKRDKIRNLLNPLPHQKLFFSYITYADPIPLFPENGKRKAENAQRSTLNAQLLLVSGIAHPEPLKRHLERHCTVRHLPFPDHHSFNRADFDIIAKTFNRIKEESKAIVTTEKDAMRLIDNPNRSLIEQFPVFYIPIQVKFFDQENFDNTIRGLITDV